MDVKPLNPTELLRKKNLKAFIELDRYISHRYINTLIRLDYHPETTSEERLTYDPALSLYNLTNKLPRCKDEIPLIYKIIDEYIHSGEKREKEPEIVIEPTPRDTIDEFMERMNKYYAKEKLKKCLQKKKI